MARRLAVVHPGLAIFVSTGFGDRLLSEVKKLAPKDVKIKVRLETLGRGCWWRWPSGIWEPHCACTHVCHSPPCPIMHVLAALGLRVVAVFAGQVVTQPFAPSRSRLLRNGCTPRGLGEMGLKQKGLGRHSSRGSHRPGKMEKDDSWPSPQVPKNFVSPSLQRLHPRLPGHL